MNLQQVPDYNNDPKLLDKFGQNLNKAVKTGKIDPVIGRDDEIRRVIQILSRKTKNNPVLIGDPGVGKTAIVEGLAQRIVRGDVPSNLSHKLVYMLDLASLVAGAKFQGEFEERLKAVMNKIKASDGQIILFIDELHLIVGAGRTQGAMDASNILKPMLARGELHAIGATTLDEYRQYIEKDAALERRFQKIMVEESTVDETIAILRGLKERFESFHGVTIHDNALVAAAKLSDKYITDRFLPDKAIDLVDEACATIKTEIASVPVELDELNRKVMTLEMEKAALQKEKDLNSQNRLKEIETELKDIKTKQQAVEKEWKVESERILKVKDLKSKIENLKLTLKNAQIAGDFDKAGKIMYNDLPGLEANLKAEEKATQNNKLLKEDVSEQEIATIVAHWTHIPVNRLLESERKRLLHLQSLLAERVKGQSEALKLVSDAILRARSGIKDPNRPIGSFIFLGPTGVGKTEVARALAFNLFKSDRKMVRIDMSEYMERHTVSRLIGAPPGYVGYEQGGQLTEKVRRNPYSIVLFDEIEKAHPEVYNILLQILDDGRITDGQGRTVNFKNTIVIMTSNIGSEFLLEEKELSFAKQKVLEKVKHSFRPEFINRVDEIIVFNPLSKDVVTEIITKELADLNQRFESLKNFKVNFSKAVQAKILAEAYDEQFGARPIKRYIQRYLETIIAEALVQGAIKENQIYYLDVNQDNEFELMNGPSSSKKLN